MQNLSPAPVIFQTNKYTDGDLRGGNVPDEFIANLMPDGPGEPILITVDGAAETYAVTFGTFSQQFNIKHPTMGGVTSSIVIESLLPDPDDGPDRLREAVTLRNDGADEVSFAGWFLRDEAHWALSHLGPLAEGQSVIVRREGMAMGLNNDADTIELVNSAGLVVDSFPYMGTQPGTTIQTGH